MPAQSQILTPPATDKSIGFFDQIFGGGWQGIIDGSASPSGPGGILFEMFAGFNAVTLAVVAILMFYVIGAGVIGTAHEGESLGRRYSTLWTPLRSAFSISLLMPLPWAKISLLQAIILKFVWFGIGGADYMADKAIGYMASQNGAITMRAPTQDVRNTTLAMLGSVVVQEYFCEIEGQCGSGTYEFTSTNGVKGFSFNPPSNDIPTDAMGRIAVVCGMDSQEICDAKLEKLREVAGEMKPFAQAIVSRWAEGSDTDPDMNEVYTAIKAYESEIQSTLQSSIDGMNAQVSADFKAFEDRAKINGWAWLGSWYWKLAHFNEKAQELVLTEPRVESVNLAAIGRYANREFGAYITRYQTFANSIYHENESNKLPEDDSLWGSITSKVSDAMYKAGTALMLTNNSEQTGAEIFAKVIMEKEPISGLQTLGHTMINTGSILLTGGAIAGTAVWAFKNFTPWGRAAAVASDVKDAIRPGSDKIGTLMTLLTPVLVTLFFSGVALAYYLPAVPFIIWTMAIIGWLTLVMETMVAAPVWAASHAIPEGEGLAGQHGRQGYLLFLGILIRPALMVIGFFMSYVIIVVAGKFIGETFMEFAGNIDGSRPWGPPAHFIGFLSVLLLGTGIVIKMTHKVFGLITWLPEKVMRWVGGTADTLGEHGDERETHSMFVGALGKIQTATASARAPYKPKPPGGGQKLQEGSLGGASPATSSSSGDHGMSDIGGK